MCRILGRLAQRWRNTAVGGGDEHFGSVKKYRIPRWIRFPEFVSNELRFSHAKVFHLQRYHFAIISR